MRGKTAKLHSAFPRVRRGLQNYYVKQENEKT